ncbi:MAG TPA: protein kinase [Verrucomicrobiae bacterium]
MKIPPIEKREPLPVEAGISKLSRIEFARLAQPVLLKEPKEFWDEVFVANEARILNGVTHPRIRRRLAWDAQTHRLFLEYVEGPTLNDLVRTGATLREPQRAHRILQSVAETMADLHAGFLCPRALVHNDLKGANVIVPAASPCTTQLIDFSHAYFEGETPPGSKEKDTSPLGTAKYTAPEKWDGDFSQGFKSDVFAFGVLAYYAHTGKYPFDGDAGQIRQQVCEVQPPSPIELEANVFRSIVAIIMACLEKEPSRRPSMEHVARCYADSACLFE